MTDTPLEICLDAVECRRPVSGAWRVLRWPWRFALLGFLAADLLAFGARLAIVAIAAAAVGLLMLAAFSGCAHVAPPPAPTPLCQLSAPPAVVGYPSSCAPHVCLGDVDAHALAAEVDALDDWARAAYAMCPHRPAVEGKAPKAAEAPTL